METENENKRKRNIAIMALIILFVYFTFFKEEVTTINQIKKTQTIKKTKVTKNSPTTKKTKPLKKDTSSIEPLVKRKEDTLVIKDTANLKANKTDTTKNLQDLKLTNKDMFLAKYGLSKKSTSAEIHRVYRKLLPYYNKNKAMITKIGKITKDHISPSDLTKTYAKLVWNIQWTIANNLNKKLGPIKLKDKTLFELIKKHKKDDRFIKLILVNHNPSIGNLTRIGMTSSEAIKLNKRAQKFKEHQIRRKK